MLEEMIFGALLQKLNEGNPSILGANEAFDLATVNPARAFGQKCGIIEPGQSADLILIDLENVYLNPRHNLIPNLVYAAQGGCVDTTICDGKVLMRNGIVEGEEEVLARAGEIAKRLARA